MIFNRTAVCLSSTILASLLIHACQAEVIQDSRSTTAGSAAQPASKADDAKTEDKTSDAGAGNTMPPPTTPGTTPAAATKYTMSWDASTDAAIVSYKVFVVPPDRNPRFPGKTDVPIQIKNYPLASLQKNGTKYTVAVTSDEVKTALGAMAASTTTYCFTIVAVNGVGNSAHSPVICP